MIPAYWQALNLAWYRAGRRVIRDFWYFLEISKKTLDKY
jgi:hypothetical protein